MKVYLAAKYERREEMLEYARLLEEDGHTVVSRWIRGEHGMTDADATPEARDRFAREDVVDVLASNVLVEFTSPPGEFNTGGRHVEFGIALATGKDVVLVGDPENIFHHLRGVHRASCFNSARSMLRWLDRDRRYYEGMVPA